MLLQQLQRATPPDVCGASSTTQLTTICILPPNADGKIQVCVFMCVCVWYVYVCVVCGVCVCGVCGVCVWCVNMNSIQV